MLLFLVYFYCLAVGVNYLFALSKIAAVLKYLCIVMLVYFVVPFLYHQNFKEILKATFVPTLQFNKEYVAILVGILGTTISPYLFFWQASVEVEEMKHKKKSLFVNKRIIHEMRQDVDFGMAFSGIVMYFIILTTGTVLFKSGIHQIDTVEQAAMALKPLAGDLAYLLFALGVIGTGLIAIPVLSGSLSYIFQKPLDGNKDWTKISRSKGILSDNYTIIDFGIGHELHWNFSNKSPNLYRSIIWNYSSCFNRNYLTYFK